MNNTGILIPNLKSQHDDQIREKKAQKNHIHVESGVWKEQISGSAHQTSDKGTKIHNKLIEGEDAFI